MLRTTEQPQRRRKHHQEAGSLSTSYLCRCTLRTTKTQSIYTLSWENREGDGLWWRISILKVPLDPDALPLVLLWEILIPLYTSTTFFLIAVASRKQQQSRDFLQMFLVTNNPPLLTTNSIFLPLSLHLCFYASVSPQEEAVQLSKKTATAV